MTAPNGVPSIPPITMLNPVVQILEQTLAEAKAGRITTIAVIAIANTGGYATLMAGHQVGDLYLGCGSLQNKILEAVEAPQKRSSIIPARMG